MYKKEFFDTLRVFVQSLLVLLLIPIALVLDWHVFHANWELSGILQPFFLGIIIIFATYSGVSIFGMEKKDRALEYLLSLPIPMWKIMAAKILPRLGLLLVLIITGGLVGVLDSIVVDGISLLIVFWLAISISLAVESIINAMVGVLLLNVILYYGSLVLSYLVMADHLGDSETAQVWVSWIFPVLLLLVPFLTAFALTVKKLDLKPLKWQARSYLRIALPALMLMIGLILLFIKKYLAWISIVG